VLFVATCNILESIPHVLRDRLEVIELPGYTNREKLEIARRFVVRRQMDAHGISSQHVGFTDAGLRAIISGYTREAGVRELERCIGTVCRRVAKGVAGGRRTRRSLSRDTVGAFLGPPEFLTSEALRRGEVGVSTGLAWTQAGGEILFIEAVKMPGMIMRESAEAAVSYLRARGPLAGLPAEIFDTHDFHVHVPAGATPKDGPSAGIAIATALASLLYGVPVRSQVAMTGEVTLTGKVLPVGGVRQKVLAAFRAGIREVVLPSKNIKDLEEIPQEVLARLRVHAVDSMDEVLPVALEGGRERSATAARLARPRARKAPERRLAARS
jgi:ATP-dependent Lon protease